MDAFILIAPMRLYRAMRKDEAGLPRCGAQANLLGARPRVDIYPDASSNVSSGAGGMSVTPDDPVRLPPHVRPQRLGGFGTLPVFELETIKLDGKLMYRPDPERPERHGFVEPRERMSFDGYQEALATTQSNWKEIK